MEYKHIARDNEQYPGSPYLTLSRFHGPTSYKSSISSETEDLLLIFDVSFVEENEMVISFPEPQLLQVSFKHGFKNTGRLSCRRDCSYTFKFPKEINEENLVAQWTEDDFLIIKEKKPTDIKESNTSGKETSAKPEKKIQDDDQENTKLETSSVSSEIGVDEGLADQSSQNKVGKSEDQGDKDLKETKGEYEKEALEGDIDLKETKGEYEKEALEGDKEFKEFEGEFKKEALEVCSKPKIFPRLVPHKVDKIFKPIICVSELKSVMSDIENKMLFVKNFIDDHAFEACSERNTETEIQAKALQNE